MNKIFNFLYRHRYDIFFTLLLIIIITFMFIVFPKAETKNIIRVMENKTFDIRQNIIAKDKKVRDDIVIITVDDPSYEYLIEMYGDWPIPRNVYAEVVEYLQKQNPKFIAFDLLFVKSLHRIPGSDEKLINVFKKYPNVYTSINFDDYSFELREPPYIDNKIKSDITYETNNIKPYLYTNCRMIINEIIAATDKVGHINTPRADDGFIRTVPLIINYPQYDKDKNITKVDNYLYMTIKLAIDYLNKYENENITEIKIDKNNNLVLGSKRLPLNENAEAILNWYGESGLQSPNTFNYISFWEIIKSIKAEESGEKAVLPENYFKDKIIYVGTSVFALSDIKTVPTSKYLPGVEIHATLLNNILDNNLIHKAALPYNIALTLLLSLAAICTVFKIRNVYVSIILFGGITFSYLYFTTYIMTKYNVWVWIIIPTLLAMFCFICSFIIKYLLKSRDFEYTYKLATTDGLTELYNHRFFQEQMKKKIEQSDRVKGNFSLILIDIDFFKKFNDKYGHQAGDAVLKHVAKTLKSCVRNEDLVCRYGGEEMTIILNNANRDTAINVAQKVCETIGSKKYALTPDLEVQITISLGVSTYPINGKNPTELIEYADKCLYKAKENGRNQVGFLDE